jgi:hypothetical protein
LESASSVRPAGLLQKLPNLNRNERIRQEVPALDAGRIAAGMKNLGQKRETEAPSDLIGTEKVLKSWVSGTKIGSMRAPGGSDSANGPAVPSSRFVTYDAQI